jgi:hypothetical protein
MEKQSNEIKITTPEGYEMIETVTSFGDKHISFVKKAKPKELTDEEKLEALEKMLRMFAEQKQHKYYLNNSAGVGKCGDICDFNHNTETVIKAERMWIMWRRLAEMLNGGKVGLSLVLCNNEKTCVGTTWDGNLYGFPRFKDKETAQKAIEMFGEANLVWMLKNL